MSASRPLSPNDTSCDITAEASALATDKSIESV